MGYAGKQLPLDLNDEGPTQARTLQQSESARRAAVDEDELFELSIAATHLELAAKKLRTFIIKHKKGRK